MGMGNTNIKENIEESVNSEIENIKEIIYKIANRHAEVYVSVTLALEDEDPTKEVTKNQFIENFSERIKELL
jgi:hypothetical protein